MSSLAAYFATKYGYHSIETVDYRSYMMRKEQGVLRSNSVKLFACAGDDHLGIGERSDLEAIPNFLESMGFEISWDKYRISNFITSYCQEYGFHPSVDGPARIHVDTPRLRLLTEFRKMGEISSFEETDPLVGKGRELSKMLEYWKEETEKVEPDSDYAQHLKRYGAFVGMVAPLLRLLSPSYMEDKVSKDVVTYLPPYIGGIGIPSPQWRWRDDRKATEYVSRFVARAQTGSDAPPNGVAWERGLRTVNKFVNSATRAGLEIEIRRSNEEFERYRQAASERGTTISNHRMAKQFFTENIAIDQPITVVSSKENAYVCLATHTFSLQVCKAKTRTRQLIKIRRSNLRGVTPLPELPTDDVLRKLVTNRLAIPKDKLAEKLGTGFCAPSLFFDSRCLGRPRKEVSRLHPFFPVGESHNSSDDLPDGLSAEVSDITV